MDLTRDLGSNGDIPVGQKNGGSGYVQTRINADRANAERVWCGWEQFLNTYKTDKLAHLPLTTHPLLENEFRTIANTRAIPL